jgi:glycosyltransferase involved in cell wall biosynthesis
MNKRIGILFSNYGPYHIARLESLKKQHPSFEYQITGIELSRFQEMYPWQAQINELDFPIVSAVTNQSLERTQIHQLMTNLLRILNQINPNILAISGYFKPSMLLALFWCKLLNKSAILFSETTEWDAPRIWWKEQIKSWIVRKYKSALVGGESHKRYLMKLGMPESAIFLGYDVVNNATFHPCGISHLPNPLKQPFFLAINRFIPKKNLLFILSAYIEYRQQVGNIAWDLVLCGDGELRSQIESQIARLNLQHVVHLPGFLQQEQLLSYFAHAGCFVHASTVEQWGLVVNEAMAAGLPVLVSNRCGCFKDLVIEGVNGFGFDPEDCQQLTQLMITISSENCDRAVMSKASLQHIQKFSPDYFANGLWQAVKYAETH